jgi:hypothetical protein
MTGSVLTRRVRDVATLAFAIGVACRPLGAQGLTSASVHGRIAGVDGTPVGGATVTATAIASGASWRVTTDAAGRYFLENVPVGGSYEIAARGIGFRPARRDGIVLALGQRHRVDLVLERAIVELSEVNVASRAGSPRDAGRTGASHTLSAGELAALPNPGRDLAAAMALSPLAVPRPFGGISIGGQNQGLNSLQVDGGVNADLYLGRTPGGASPSAALPEVIPHVLALDAVEEFQLMVAPFDVRHGNFAGGLLNVVTKSGTNELRGSVFGYLQSGKLVARNAAGRRPELTTTQLGATLGGPIVRDRAHYFLSADVQRRSVPDAGLFIGSGDRTGVSDASAARFRWILDDVYGLDAGALSSDGRLAAEDLFAKVTMQLGLTGRVELSHHHARGDRRGFMDVGRTFDSTALSSVAGHSRSSAATSRLIWTALLRGRAHNELIVSRARLRDTCRPDASFPLIQVRADAGTLIAGPNSVCPTTDVDQHAIEVTENLTVAVGRHLGTLGSHAEVLDFRDPLVQVSAGRWDFLSLDSLERGEASHYDRGLPGPVRPPGADFRVYGVGIYAQDRWAPTERLTLTTGLRADVPYMPDDPPMNAELLASSGIDTGRLPGGIPLWSPRVGVEYDAHGDGVTRLRGGIGLFGGPPPYRWLGNAYRESGDESVVLCDRPDVPAFTPMDQPTACRDGASGRSPRVSFFDRGFRRPQNLRIALGVDRRLPRGIVASVDVLFTRAVHQVHVDQANLVGPVGEAAGEGGRPLYGTIGGSGLAAPAWHDTTFGQKEVYRVSSRGGDHSVSVSTQLRKHFGERVAVYATYAFSRTRDRMSLVNFPARANFSNTPVDGTLENRRLRPSFFDTPHKVAAVATFRLPYQSALALSYVGASQPPYTFVINGDANADGIGGSGSLKNDAAYVPRNGGDITLMTPSDSTRLMAFIDRNRCLREQRGRVMARGSCRNGWLGVLSARVTKSVHAGRSQRVELVGDVFNLPNLLNQRWGLQRDVTTGPSVTLLTLAGWDADSTRGRYRVPPLRTSALREDVGSRWRVQLGARYYR